MSSPGIQKYTEKSIVVRNADAALTAILMANRGTSNMFGGVPGIMFPLTQENKVRSLYPFPQGYITGPSQPPKLFQQPQYAAPAGFPQGFRAPQSDPFSDLIGKLGSSSGGGVMPSTPAIASPPSRSSNHVPYTEDDDDDAPGGSADVSIREMFDSIRKELVDLNTKFEKELSELNKKLDEALKK